MVSVRVSSLSFEFVCVTANDGGARLRVVLTGLVHRAVVGHGQTQCCVSDREGSVYVGGDVVRCSGSFRSDDGVSWGGELADRWQLHSEELAGSLS